VTIGESCPIRRLFFQLLGDLGEPLVFAASRNTVRQSPPSVEVGARHKQSACS
jgi:hypothetical protein